MDLDATQETNLEHALRGGASKIYWLLLKNTRPLGAYEIQRQMHFKHPIFTIQRHLDELTSLGLAEKQGLGNYVASSKVESDVLRHYVNLGRLLFPRYLFYALFTTLFYSAFMLFLVERVSRESVFIGFFGAFVCLAFWYEAKRFWSLRPY